LRFAGPKINEIKDENVKQKERDRKTNFGHTEMKEKTRSAACFASSQLESLSKRVEMGFGKDQVLYRF
jgi:hypothetical protein